MKMTDGSAGATNSQASTSPSPSVTVQVSDTELSQMVEVLAKQVSANNPSLKSPLNHP